MPLNVLLTIELNCDLSLYMYTLKFAMKEKMYMYVMYARMNGMFPNRKL